MKGKKIVKVLEYILFGVFLLILVVGTTFLVKSKLSGNGVPSFGGYKMLVVLTGSMSPTFDPGSVIIIKKVKPESLSKGDIITFKKPFQANTFITHRIAKVIKKDGIISFKTKGDANKAADVELIPTSSVEGKTTFSIPLIGYVFQFIKTPKGLVLLVVLPGLYIVVSELRKIVLALKEIDTKAEGRSEQ